MAKKTITQDSWNTLFPLPTSSTDEEVEKAAERAIRAGIPPEQLPQGPVRDLVEQYQRDAINPEVKYDGDPTKAPF